MSEDDDEAKATFHVVVNHEEQYSVWMDGRDVPAGWRMVGVSGPKSECLAYIDKTWTDMRPLSLRRQMEELERNPPVETTEIPDYLQRPSLVERLSEGKHPVELVMRPEKSAAALRKRLDDNYVHVRFSATYGGTELGVAIDRELSDIDDDVLDAETGFIRICGSLTLDYVPVYCTAEVDVCTMTGEGWLKPRPEVPSSAARHD